ncbi:MAG: saccharopine dehydrogenase NADP-binding domain-containing protein [Sphingobacteriales bacterium]|nr:saccharopine dehydrogenase NADP-binding domain-containing protein [Sphingobacteriales bacterium]
MPCFFIMHILILGAGKSSLYLIQYLLQAAAEAQWRITVGDLSLEQAAAKINAHPCGEAVVFDIHNEEHRREYVSQADIVVSLLPATLHTLVAGECLKHGAHLVTASYITAEAAALDEAFRAAGLLFMGELGLDPGIDHLAIMELLHRLRGQGAQLHAVQSHTGALIAPESDTNPWHYKFSWAPMNVVLAGQGVSRYLHEGAIKYLPYRRLFENYWVRPIAGIGDMEIYANRNS